MYLTLVIPGLLDVPSSALDQTHAEGEALARLLTTSASPPIECEDALAELCRSLGVVRQADWPIAACLAHAAGIDREHFYWLCADPVAVEVGRSDVRVAGLVEDLSPDEAHALTSLLNAHFAADGLRFAAVDPSRWLVGCESTQQLITRPPFDAIGGPLLDYLPTGADSARWRRWQNEMQMLLFEHPLNTARDTQGRARIDSVCLFGGGHYRKPRPAVVSVRTDREWIRDLARSCDVAAGGLPAAFATVSATAAQTMQPSTLVWLNDIDAAALPGQLGALNRAWIAPLTDALTRGVVDQLRVVITGRRRALAFVPRRRSLLARMRERFAPRGLSALLHGTHD